MQKKVLYCSILKPAADVRAYYKIGFSIAKIENTKFISIGNELVGEVLKFSNSELISLKNTNNSFSNRLKSYYSIVKKIIEVNPQLIIVNTPDLLLITSILKIIFGFKMCYDIQENHSLNILYNRTKKGVKYYLLSKLIFSLEVILSKYVDVFWVSEPVYFKQLPYLKNRNAIMLPNAFLDMLKLSQTLTNNSDTKLSQKNSKQVNDYLVPTNLTKSINSPLSTYNLKIYDVKRRLFCQKFNHKNDSKESTKSFETYLHYRKEELYRFKNGFKQETTKLCSAINLNNGDDNQDFLRMLIKERFNGHLKLIISGTISEKYGVLEGIELATKLKKACSLWNYECSLIITGHCLSVPFGMALQELVLKIDYSDWISLRISNTPISYLTIDKAVRECNAGILCYPELDSFFSKIPTKAWDYLSNNLVIFSNKNTKEMLNFSNLVNINAKLSNFSILSNTKMLSFTKYNAKFSKKLLNTSWEDYEPTLLSEIENLLSTKT